MNSADRERSISITRYLIEKLRRRCSPNIAEAAFCRLLFPDLKPANRLRQLRGLLDGSIILTTSSLVSLIRCINQSNDSLPHGQLLTPEEILILFQQLIQLRPQEKQELGGLTGIEDVLLQQALLNMCLYHDRKNYETFLNLYRTSVNLPTAAETGENAIQELYDRISKNLSARPNYLPRSSNRDFIQELEVKARREVNKILLKSGAQHNQFWNTSNHTAYIERYLTTGFIDRLTQAVAENELLTRDFPIYIKTITIKELGTLPLPVMPTTGDGLFNKDLLDLDRLRSSRGQASPSTSVDTITRPYQIDLSDLALQSAISVTIYFSLQRGQNKQVDFVLTSSGIGGTLAQIIKVINTALLSDIACLKDQENGRDFFPIAHDVMVDQEIIQNGISSPVWAHSVVMLCHSDILAQAMTESTREKVCFYDQIASANSVGRGDCCDFDFLLTVARAALYARLRAIKHTGVDPKTYVDHLRQRIEDTRLTQEATSHVASYPFSSLAQEGWLREMLLEYWDMEIPVSASQAFFNAYLLIVETFLQEGMYRRAYGYLRRLKPALSQLTEQAITWYNSFNGTQSAVLPSTTFRDFSGSLLVRYQLCWATYYYLLDREFDRGSNFFDGFSSEDNQRTIIQRAWSALNRAEELAEVRLAKYLIIDEFSQGTFHPHYHLLAQIYFLRVRMLLFFPRLIPIDQQRQYLPTDIHATADRRDANAIYGGWLYLLEKTRLYAACDGNQELYACYTAYQSCVYVTAAFLDQELRLTSDNRGTTLSQKDCMKWARQLRNHALLSYANTGRQCYYQIKEKSGISRSLNRSYGRYSIEEIPPIREMLNRDDESPGQHDDGVLYIDMELLSIPRECCQSVEDNGDPKERIYLFGPNASYLLFARGLYHLCSDERKEFETAGPLATPQEWDKKLSCAYHLFTYAWAMAEDGGRLECPEEEDGTIRIERNFTAPQETTIGAGEYASAHAKSVRDLYPHRVNEVADLAKIFMSATALLRVYINIENREQLMNDFTGPLHNLHRTRHFDTNPVLRSVLKGQYRYNGHLATFLDRCTYALENEIRDVQPLANEHLSHIVMHRTRILKRLFDGFYSDSNDSPNYSYRQQC